MVKLSAIAHDTASQEAKEAFAEAQQQFGAVINLFRVTGHAPNVLKGILALNKHVGDGTELSSDQVEQVAMLVSALNRCDYCVNVHMQVGKGAGLSEKALLDAMAGTADDPKAQALLDFTNEVVRNRGLVSDVTVTRARQNGLSNKALLECIGIIGIYTTLQYVRHFANPEHDFPMVTAFNADQHGSDDGPLYTS